MILVQNYLNGGCVTFLNGTIDDKTKVYQLQEKICIDDIVLITGCGEHEMDKCNQIKDVVDDNDNTTYNKLGNQPNEEVCLKYAET